MASLKRIIVGIALVVLGIVMIVTTAGELADNAKTPENFSELSVGDFKAGMMVEGDLPYNYGKYESYTITENGQTSYGGLYYLIPVGDDGTDTLGLYATQDSMMSALNVQTDAYYNAEYVEDLESISSVHFKGKVTEMDSEDRQYYTEALTDFGLDSAYIAEHCPYLYIDCRVATATSFPLYIGIFCAAVGLFMFLWGLRSKLMGR